MRVEPTPTPEEAAAILAALETLQEKQPEERTSLKRSRWRLAGLIGYPPLATMKLEGSLWSYSCWESV